MRFGMSGCFLPEDMREVTPELCRRVRGLGFSGVYTRFRANSPFDTAEHVLRQTRDVLEGEGVRLFQTTGYWQNLVTPDEAMRGEAVKTLQAALRVAGALGARAVDTGPGSLNPDGPWFPHPSNWTFDARRQLVKSLKECARAAEDLQVYLSVEGHQLVTLDSAEVTREILDEVESPWVKCGFDSANWITLPTIFNTGPAIDHMFDVLGERIVSCHAKDIWVENRLTLHLQDGCPGKGLMDFKTLFIRMQQLNPDYPIIVEGAATEDLPFVSELFRMTAAELDFPVLDS
jgi:sugar phosphate isomerase/epimerase